MFTVQDIAADAKRFLANCNDPTLFNRLNYAVEALANESDWDPLISSVDIDTETTPATGDPVFVSLPREVETILSLNIGTQPAQARNRYFTFHLNGPGDETVGAINPAWDDKGDYPTVVDVLPGTQLLAFPEEAADVTVEIWAYGYDTEGRWVRSTSGGAEVDGVLVVSTLTPTDIPAANSVKFDRITRIRKGTSKGYIPFKGFALVDAATVVTTLGDYAPTELEPSYRRIKLNQNAGWVRVIFRNKVFKIESLTDRIPLHSPFALLQMLKALRKMEDDQIEDGEKYYASAVKFITKEQLSRNPVTTPELQVRGPLIASRRDRLD